MSLNGLNGNVVVQAHQAVLTEAGGWFLLKYTNRDTVKLFKQGNGGVGEARSAISSHDEKSPLYGLVQYRRKKVILKYVPEGTSRLLQVRLAVHFQSVLDTFTPHDTVFSFTTADELSESALGLNAMLQSSSSKKSSSSTLGQQRLNEIAEDSEESPNTEKPTEITISEPAMAEQQIKSGNEIDGLPASAARAKAMLAKRRQESIVSAGIVSEGSIKERPMVTREESIVPLPTPGSYHPRSHSIATEKDLPAPPPFDQGSPPVVPPKHETTIPRLSIDLSLSPLESDSDDDFRRPIPSQVRYSQHLSKEESSSISKWSDDVLASTATKQKQRRGPRPSDKLQVRPETSANADDTGPSRPVANLPHSVRVSTRNQGQSSRPGSQQSARSVPGRFVPSANLPPPVPSPTHPTFSAQRPSQSRASPSQASSLAMDNPLVTPEKMRLMKALQMRKRNQLLAQRSASAAPVAVNPLASIDSSLSGISEDPTTRSSTPNTDNKASTSHAPELASINESQATSPTSIVTASDQRSTKPSSLSENSDANKSHASLSSDTNSSTMPKAGQEKKQSGTRNFSRSYLPEVEESPALLASDSTLGGTLTTTDENEHPTIYTDTAVIAAASTPMEESQHELGLARFDEFTIHDQADILDVSQATRAKKRYHFDGKIIVPPLSAEGSDISDDDSFMEELQNATVHEAKPMFVNRTPVTPVLSKAPMRDQMPMSTRKTSRSPSNDSQFSTPDRKRTASQAGSTRSLSTALPQWPPPNLEPVPALPKNRPPVGASISKRIKTFEGLSQRDSIASVAQVKKEPASRGPSFSGMLKRASFISHPLSTEAPLEKTISNPTPSPLRAEHKRMEEHPNSRPLLQRPGTSTEVYSPTHKGESISITAKIVRDPIKPKSAHGTSDTTRNMHRSPLIVEHETFDKQGMQPLIPRELTVQSMESLTTSPVSEKRRFSFSSHKSFRQQSPTGPKSNLMSFASPHRKSSRAPSETSSVAEDKRVSRASRMLKRLSGIGKARTPRHSMAVSPSRDCQHADTIEEQNENDLLATRHVVDIGEVNVQFPEALLWKRRFLRVDNSGFLIFAPPTNDFSSRGRSRKIHLDEFSRPTLPDRERQEMAWSILLDLKAGGTVQCACESKKAQKSVLKMLLDAHNAYHQLYGT